MSSLPFVPSFPHRNVPAYGAYEAAMMKHSLRLADSLGVNLRTCLAWAWLFNGYPSFQGYRTLSTNGIHKRAGSASMGAGLGFLVFPFQETPDIHREKSEVRDDHRDASHPDADARPA